MSGAAIAVAVVLAAIAVNLAVHKVPQGHVGVYYRVGAHVVFIRQA